MRRFPSRLPLWFWMELSGVRTFALAYLTLGIYRILWLPHWAQNPEFNFWQVHQQIFN